MKVDKLFFFTLLIVFSCNQAQESSDRGSEFPPGSKIEAYDDIPGLVRVMQYDDLGVLLGEGDFLNGQKHGSWIEYDPRTKIVKSIETYFEGKLQGVSLRMDNYGNIESKESYYQNKRHGISYTYANRKVTSKKNYNNGVLEGLSIKYYRNGNKMEEATYKNGAIDGMAKWYDQEGNVKIQYLYENGNLVDKNPTAEKNDTID